MTNKIVTDNQLDVYVNLIAEEIWETYKESVLPNVYDMINVYVDGSEHVINSHKARTICATCNTDRGEEYLRSVGVSGDDTFNSMASTIVYGELVARITDVVECLRDEQQEEDMDFYQAVGGYINS